jgi:hypothetical protein
MTAMYVLMMTVMLLLLVLLVVYTPITTVQLVMMGSIATVLIPAVVVPARSTQEIPVYSAALMGAIAMTMWIIV